MKVIKEFYRHSEKKSYKVGDEYKGDKFDGIEEYVEVKKKTKQARQTKKGAIETK
jgi:hypothetical protein